jgi:hypothetical protein
MRVVRGAVVVILLAILPGLTGCLDSREEIWIERSGAGRAELLYQFPASAMLLHGGADGLREMCAEFLAESPELENSSCGLTVSGNQASLRISFDFGSAKDLIELADRAAIDDLPGAAREWLGELAASIKGREVGFRRVIELSKVAPGIALVPKSKLTGHKLETVVHLPVVADFHNADHLEQGGAVLCWSVPVSVAAKRAVVQEFRATWPLPPWLPALTVVPVLILGALVLRRGFRRSGGA